jgi:Ras-related GTP-binding protein A/B
MKKKVLLMGKSGSGKTSMRSIIFANYLARDTRRLGATIDVEHSHVRFLGNLVLNLWDCGGQDVFMENYIASQKDYIFKSVQVLIYVFDVESREFERDLHYYTSSLASMQENSPNAHVFVLIHKIDLIRKEAREVILREKEQEIRKKSSNMNLTVFATSIWDESLYKAWSAIVYSLVPNVQLLEEQLSILTQACCAREAVLFEKTTFLVISSSTKSNTSKDPHRFEKISNIMKQFKLSCS